MAYNELPSNRPPEKIEQSVTQKTAVDSRILSQDVQAKAYTEMISSIDSRYATELGNVLKRYIKAEVSEKGPAALVACKKNIDSFNAMWDKLPQVAEKLGVHANTKPDHMVSMLASNGVLNPEQTALVQLLAIKTGINATLRGEYVAYIGALKIPDILAKYHELTR